MPSADEGLPVYLYVLGSLTVLLTLRCTYRLAARTRGKRVRIGLPREADEVLFLLSLVSDLRGRWYMEFFALFRQRSAAEARCIVSVHMRQLWLT